MERQPHDEPSRVRRPSHEGVFLRPSRETGAVSVALPPWDGMWISHPWFPSVWPQAGGDRRKFGARPVSLSVYGGAGAGQRPLRPALGPSRFQLRAGVRAPAAAASAGARTFSAHGVDRPQGPGRVAGPDRLHPLPGPAGAQAYADGERGLDGRDGRFHSARAPVCLSGGRWRRVARPGGGGRPARVRGGVAPDYAAGEPPTGQWPVG